MDARLQRRVQRYGWDLAADDYEPSWQAQLALPQQRLLQGAFLRAGERVLDVACGTGLVSLAAAHEIGPTGEVTGVDLSNRMVDAARKRAKQLALHNTGFMRMDAEELDLPDASFDAVLCALGLMYVPHPERALSEMRRVLRPGGRMGAAVWGERARCGWADVFSIVDAEVKSEVCPLFFQLGRAGELERQCDAAGFATVTTERITTWLDYPNAASACRAVFTGGPAALAWSRFDADTRERVTRRYLDSITAWRMGTGYRVPAEFVVVSASAPGADTARLRV